MPLNEVVIVSAVRTPVGRLGGSLKDVLPEDLVARTMNEALKKIQLEKEQVEEVILGHAKQSSDNPNIARLALLKAGFPVTIPAYTVHRQCGSGLQAFLNGVHQIMLGNNDILLVGGVESMSTAPYYMRHARYGITAGNSLLLDPNTESQPRSQPSEEYGELTMGYTAENLATKYNITREEQDEFAALSQQKALTAIESGRFTEEIIPVPVPKKKGQVDWITTDEHPRKVTAVDLSKLKPVFKQDGTVTAGNSSGRNDGASVLVIMSLEKANELGLKPLAKFISEGVAGVSPEIMGIGPVEATKQALKRGNLSVEDLDLIELNEAFAAQSLAVIKELKLPIKKVNVNGGAIALGHPIGNSGARILVTLVHEMQKRESNYGLATLCIAGGLGLSCVIQRV